jgi:hypothetical protein
VTFFRVSDCFWSSPKTVLLSDAAVALWVRAGSYCGQHLTDGHVPRGIIRLFQSADAVAKELVAAGLWVEVDEGFQFHDWTDYNRDSSAVKRDRELSRERQRKWAARKRESNAVSDELLTEEERESNVVDGGGMERNGKERKDSLEKKETEFDVFWKTYPRKVGKQAALKAWKAAVRLTDGDTIIAGARRLRDDPNREQQFTPHPATWLNQGRWDDEPLPARAVGKLTAGEERLRNYQRLMDQFTPAKGIEA